MDSNLNFIVCIRISPLEETLCLEKYFGGRECNLQGLGFLQREVGKTRQEFLERHEVRCWVCSGPGKAFPVVRCPDRTLGKKNGWCGVLRYYSVVQPLILLPVPMYSLQSGFCVDGGFSMGINEGAQLYFWIDILQNWADEITRTWVLEIAEILERTLVSADWNWGLSPCHLAAHGRDVIRWQLGEYVIVSMRAL